MRKMLTAAAIVVAATLAAPSSQAQTVHDEIALSRAQIQADRQTIVGATLGLSDAEAKVFWPLYRDYRADAEKHVDKMWDMFVKYGDTWSSMSNADASKLLDQWLTVEKDLTATKQKWAKTMKKKLPAADVARFFQIDNKLDTIIRLEAAGEIPLVVKKP